MGNCPLAWQVTHSAPSWSLGAEEEPECLAGRTDIHTQNGKARSSWLKW